MRKSRSRVVAKVESALTIGVFFLSSASAALAAGSAFAAEENRATDVAPRFAPAWNTPSEILQQPNASFLLDQVKVVESDEVEFLQNLIDDEMAIHKRMEYQRLQDNYELRRAHDLNGLEGQRVHAEQMHNFSRSLVNEVRRRKVKEEGRKIRERVEDMEEIQDIQGPLGVALALAAAYSGEPLRLKVDDDFGLMARTDVPNQRGELKLGSPVLNGSVSFIGAAPAYRDPYGPVPQDPTQREERYKFSLYRNLPLLDIQSALSFGSTTRTLTASLSKSLTDHLRLVLDASNREDHVKFFYDFKF